MQPPTSLPPTPARTFLGHPPGLTVLFLAQMWERFSYFGMVALLLPYLTTYFKLPQEEASFIYKCYTSVIYFTPLIGAVLADRVLGHKPAVLLGAVLMALGHFLMAFPSLGILYAALTLLVLGCGLLTPPLTTQVGLLYPPHDPRRDSGYTLFYMGINLGASLSPLLCGWLRENTVGRFHSGFTVAGLGMLLALVTYVVGWRWIVEVDQSTGRPVDDTAGNAPEPIEQKPSAFPGFSRKAPELLIVGGMAVAVLASAVAVLGLVSWATAIFLAVVAAAALLFGWVSRTVTGALRDRVLAVLLLTVFATLYLIGSGQYGNAINVWAEQNTDRYLTRPAPAPDPYPEPTKSDDDGEAAGFWERWTSLFERLPRDASEAEKTWGQWWSDQWNPMPTASFQSVNPLLILLLGPLLVPLWIWLGRRGRDPSVSTKTALGLLLMGLAFAVLWIGAGAEARETTVAFASERLPAPLAVNAEDQVGKADKDQPFNSYAAGRLFLDSGSKRLRMVGVFPMQTRDQIVADTAEPFAKKLEELQKSAEKAATGDAKHWSSHVVLDPAPADMDLRYAGFETPTGNKQVRYDPGSRTLTTTIPLEEKELVGLKVAAGDPALRAALDQLMIRSDSHRISARWLLGFFLLGTLGELCLVPVGMSMVSQLAPARFATLLMSLWLLSFALGNFLAGALGEKWGTWPPQTYFLFLTAFLGGAALLVLALRKKNQALMHLPDAPTGEASTR